MHLEKEGVNGHESAVAITKFPAKLIREKKLG